MVTKGIITSIDFNGNTCQVRIPLFETAGNDPITGTAIVSNTPGSYNGYKVGDVVLVAFEDGKMQNPVIVGKLYLGAAKEKQDPRGTINVETTTASKSASLPADAVLTANVDSNVPNTNTPFGSLASIANNLNSLNTDVNQLDRFTRNQFNSVITDVNDQGEQLRSEIKQTAENIEANVVHTHKDGSQKGLGWNLDEKEWKINAQDTVNGEAKDINIVTIDRNGMSIAGDLKLSGYPRNITVLYAQTGPSENYPTPLYTFTEVKFPVPFPSVGEDKDETWYYGKYIKIDENYVLIFKENFDHYKKLIDLGITKAYNREINPKWSTDAPQRADGKYIWQWTHTEIYSFDGNKWSEKDDDKIACITGADGKDGYNTVTVMLYKRSTASITGNPINIDLYYKFSDQKLYTDADCTIEYDLPEGWSYTINGAGDSINGDLYCIAAVAHSNTDSDSIPHSEWAGPTLYVENGVSGTSVAQLTLYQRAASAPNNPTKDGTWTYNAANGSLTCNKKTEWKTSIPSETEPCYESHAAVLVTGLGTTTVTTWSEPAKFVENGADGKPGDSVYTISIDNDFDSVPADVNGKVSSDYSWESETTHKVRVYYGKESQDFVIVGPNETASETGLCLKYKLTNVTLDPENITPESGVSSKVATAWINDLSADTGNILYTLYVDGVDTGITGKFSVTKIKSPAPTYTISIDNDFATIPTSTVNAKIYRKTSQKFKPIDNGYNRETITIAGATKKLPGMRLSVINNTTNLNTALLWKPDEVIKITPDITKSYVEDITKHNVTVYCNDTVETITTDNFIVKLDSDGLDADMDETQNYLVCELGGFDSTGARATDFPGMNPVVNNNVVTNYITALSALGDASESKNVYIQYTYYVKGKPVATAKFEVTRHTGPTTYYLSSNVSTIKINKNVNPATITPDKITCTAYSLDTSTNTNTKFTNGIWRYKWDNGDWSLDKSTASDLEISTANVITKNYKQLYIELYLDNQLWDRETIDVIADGENAVDYRIIASSGTIKVSKTGDKTPRTINVNFKKTVGQGEPVDFSGTYKVFIDNGTVPISQGTANSIVLATSGAASYQIDVSKAKSSVTVDLYTTDGSTKLESETIDVVADGADGQPGVYIKEVKQWYILKASSFPELGSEQTPETIKPADNDEPTYDPAPTSTTVDEWMSTPPEAVNDYVVWTCYGSIFSDDTSSKRHIEYSVPVKDNAYALAQGKTTNYYSDTDPTGAYSVKKGDCWFDTGYVKIDPNPENKTGYLGKFVLRSDSDPVQGIDPNDKIYVQGIEPNTDGTFTRFIPSTPSLSQLYMIKIGPDNIDTLINNKTIVVGTTEAFETGSLKQWDGANWVDIAGELVTNKLTAKYINAMDITAKKLLIKNDNKETLLDAGWTNDNKVTIGGFDITNNSICSTNEYKNDNEEPYKKPVVYIGTSETDKAYKVGTLSTKNWRLLIGDNFGVTDTGKLVVQEGTFSGSLAASGGSITNMSTIQGDSVECSKLSLTNNCVISTTALVDDSATRMAPVIFTININKLADGGDWYSSYIGGDTYYSVKIHANRQLAESTNIGTLISATLSVPNGSSGGSGAGTTVRKIYFNKSIIFPANVLETYIGITGATFGMPGATHEVIELTFSEKSFSPTDEKNYKQTIMCLTPVEKYTYSSEFSSSIVPKTTDLNLGASSRSWNEVYATDMYATYFYGTSDRRLKKNIKDYVPKSSILDLPVVEFDFKDSGKHQIGCIAQDLQKLFPELVETRDDGYLTIEENKLVYLLLLEIKKLNQRINTLETNLSSITSNKELK